MGEYDGDRRNDVWYSTGLNGVEEKPELLSVDPLPLEVYPNPAKSFLTIRLPRSADRSEIKIFDLSGKIVKEIRDCFPESGRNDNVVRVSLDGIKNGIYFVRADNFNQIIKIIVTK